MKRIAFIAFLTIISLSLQAVEQEPVVSVYDEFDDGLFGKSIHRGVVLSVKKAAFARSESLPVSSDDSIGYLTAVVLSHETAQKLMDNGYELPSMEYMGMTIYRYVKEGLDFSFSLEKASEKLIQMVSDFYSDDEVWHDPLVQYYRDNYVIRIHRAENIIDSWSDEITYNEAMIAATLLGDSDQWLWGIHDGSDILNKGY